MSANGRSRSPLGRWGNAAILYSCGGVPAQRNFNNNVGHRRNSTSPLQFLQPLRITVNECLFPFTRPTFQLPFAPDRRFIRFVRFRIHEHDWPTTCRE
jgi:hypothetical protein